MTIAWRARRIAASLTKKVFIEVSTIKQEVADLPQPVSFLEAVIYWLKLGFISFGGPAGQISMMHQELVEKRRWISEHRFLHALNYTMVLPPLFILSGLTWIYLVYGDVPFPYIVLMAGASIATLFTFLPSFLFILLGGPAVEATRGDIKFTAPLTGITAAVVGVILNLALFFAYHVLWPEGFEGMFEWFSLFIGAVAFIALFRYKAGIVTVIAACAVVGLGYSLLL